DGARQIAVPAFVSTLCICIVFVPVAFISGAAKYLFTPLAMAVVFAMLTSYLLSRTLVPTLVHYLLASEVERYGGKREDSRNRENGSRRHLVAWTAAALVLVAIAVRWRSAAPAIGAGALALLLVRLLVVRWDVIWRIHHAFDRRFQRLRR